MKAFAVGDRVKRVAETDAIPAFQAMRGTVQVEGPYDVKVLWDCDKEAGFRDGTWISPGNLELAP